MKKILVQGVLLGCAAVMGMYVQAYIQYSTYVVKIINKSAAAYEVHCGNFWLVPVYKSADVFGSEKREFPIVDAHSTLDGLPCRILSEEARKSQNLQKVYLQKIKDNNPQTASLPDQIIILDPDEQGGCPTGTNSMDIVAQITTHDCVNSRGQEGKIALIIEHDGRVTMEEIPYF